MKIELPEGEKKPRKANYKKSDSVKELQQLALTHSRTRYPEFPEAARSTRNYSDKTANGLQKCIIDFLNFSSHQAERINCTGRYVDNTEVVTDCLDRKMIIGSGAWLPTSGQKGTADISATIWGRSEERREGKGLRIGGWRDR